MNIKNFRHKELQISQFKTEPGKSWCIYGGNSSGIDSFVDLLTGDLEDFTASQLHIPANPGIISFKHQQEIFEEELRNDDSDFLDKIDPGTPAKNFLPNYKNHLPLIHSFGMDNTLEQGYRQLSSGQCRKLLILKELLSGKTNLIIQNPYDGLDEESCHELDSTFSLIDREKIQLLAIVNSILDIPVWCSHLAIIDKGIMSSYGIRDHILPFLPAPQPAEKQSQWTDGLPEFHPPPQQKPLVALHNGFAGYGEKTLFHGLDLKIYPGDHTLITGPNGCGKSTLLDIITGDNPKCYANDLEIFGKQRGSGESIWELKKHMGIVSPTLHRDHRIPGSVLQIILSGLFDSIGLYQKASDLQTREARDWLARIGLQQEERSPFRKLAHADQRLVLIARAIIKLPKLLILDEPTQGLDDMNKNRLLWLLETIANLNISTIIFVSHRRDEYRPFFRQHIELNSYTDRPS